MDTNKFTVANDTGNTNILGSLHIGGSTINPEKLKVTGSAFITGVTTIGDQLHVRGNDIALGTNAGPTAGRALVKSGNRLVINYNNDFSDGVRIGGDNDNTPASNLIVTGATTWFYSFSS